MLLIQSAACVFFPCVLPVNSGSTVASPHLITRFLVIWYLLIIEFRVGKIDQHEMNSRRTWRIDESRTSFSMPDQIDVVPRAVCRQCFLGASMDHTHTRTGYTSIYKMFLMYTHRVCSTPDECIRLQLMITQYLPTFISKKSYSGCLFDNSTKIHENLMAVHPTKLPYLDCQFALILMRIHMK